MSSLTARVLPSSRVLLGGLLWAACAAAVAEADAPPPEPQGFRMEMYRAPVPAALAGARVIDTEEAFRLWTTKSAAFVDVLPRPPKPANLPPETVWRDKPRHDIPGSVWLPDTGYGVVLAERLDYLKHGLEKASGGDPARPLVIYCLADCWMSWNAGKRALLLGYQRVLWFPEGTDGWSAAGHPLEERTPEPDARRTSAGPD
jgi:PQQ-dependent catabolism-associated CXXCW motif protein